MRERAPQKRIYFQVSKYLLHLHTYTINAIPVYYLWYGAINDYTDKTFNIEKTCVYASELRKF